MAALAGHSAMAGVMASNPAFGPVCTAEPAGEIGTMARFRGETAPAPYLGMANLSLGARIVICGSISTYNRLGQPDIGPRHMRTLLVKRARMQGFLVFDYAERYREARAELAAWLGDGRLIHKEDVADGIEAAPAAFLRLLTGENFGKQLVRIGPDPTI